MHSADDADAYGNSPQTLNKTRFLQLSAKLHDASISQLSPPFNRATAQLRHGANAIVSNTIMMQRIVICMMKIVRIVPLIFRISSSVIPKYLLRTDKEIDDPDRKHDDQDCSEELQELDHAVFFQRRHDETFTSSLRWQTLGWFRVGLSQITSTQPSLAMKASTVPLNSGVYPRL